MKATLFPQTHLSPSSSVQCAKLLSATWWRCWWKKLTTGNADEIFQKKKKNKHLNYWFICSFTNLSFRSVSLLWDLGVFHSPCICLCLLRTSRPRAESWLGDAPASCLPFPNSKNLNEPAREDQWHTLPALPTLLPWQYPATSSSYSAAICSRFRVYQMIHDTGEKNN